jgi:hypothetical protein
MSLVEEDPFLLPGDIELIVLLGPCPLQRKYDALRVVWTWPFLQGPYTDIGRTVEPAEAFLSSASLRGRLYGYARTFNGKRVKISTNLVMLEDEVSWLRVDVPIYSVREAYPVGEWPVNRSASEPWVLEFYGWLSLLAEHVFEQVNFQRGIVGFEASMVEWDWLYEPQQPAPKRRFYGFLVAKCDGLEYLAPNTSDPLVCRD